MSKTEVQLYPGVEFPPYANVDSKFVGITTPGGARITADEAARAYDSLLGLATEFPPQSTAEVLEPEQAVRRYIAELEVRELIKTREKAVTEETPVTLGMLADIFAEAKKEGDKRHPYSARTSYCQSPLQLAVSKKLGR